MLPLLSYQLKCVGAIGAIETEVALELTRNVHADLSGHVFVD